MTQLCCPSCRLRFDPAASAYITACSECGKQLQRTRVESSLGFRLVGPQDLPFEFDEAIAAALPVPDPGLRP